MEQILIVSSILLWVVVLFNLLLTLALVRRMSNWSATTRDVETLEIGQRAPDFTAETLDGRTVTLADFDGRPLALVFMSPTCSPCMERLPELEALGPKARRSGVELVLVYKTDLAETRAAVGEHGITLPALAAPETSNPFWQDYMVAGTPFYCVLDEDRKVLSTGLFGPEWRRLTQEWSRNGSNRVA